MSDRKLMTCPRCRVVTYALIDVGGPVCICLDCVHEVEPQLHQLILDLIADVRRKEEEER